MWALSNKLHSMRFYEKFLIGTVGLHDVIFATPKKITGSEERVEGQKKRSKYDMASEEYSLFLWQRFMHLM